jgi:hypothetical protein
MPQLFLDYLYHNNRPINEYVKVFDENNQFISVKENNGSQTSHTYLVTHKECSQIAFELHEKFSEICRNIEAPVYNLNDLNDRIEKIQFSQYFAVGPFNRFNGFQDLNCDEYNIGIIVTNDYHLKGKLEILLGYIHNISDSFNVIEKWSPSDKPSIFDKINNQIDPRVDNFNPRERHDLLKNIVQSAFDMFSECIKDLKNFIISANTFQIDHEKIVPVYLDIKNRNRSKTSLMTNDDRVKKISNDVSASNSLIERLNREDYCYTDFLLLISMDRFKLDTIYTHFNSAELTSSRAYKDLIKKVDSFNRPQFKERFEHEQEVAYLNIREIVG